MADTDLLDEIDDLKEEIDNLKQELQATIDDRDSQLDNLRGQLEKIKTATENEWKKKLKEADREARERTAVMALELDMMRQAFSGDTGGWEKVETPTQEYYKNSETGEVRQEEPEVLFVARSMKKCQEAEEMLEETKQLRQTKLDNEAKIKELNLQINKTKTELNSLKNMDKSWKEATKTIHASMIGARSMLDAQMDQIMTGLSAISKVGKRVHNAVPLVYQTRDQYAQLKTRVRQQEDEIIKANAKIRHLTVSLDETTAKVNRLSAGLDEEVERLAKPMRDRMAESMVQVMKEKAARAQERRELADLWPKSLMMPTLLMQYRTLDEGERKRRVERYHAINANAALVLEIRANIKEKTRWTQEFDDYGRPFYQHMDTKQTSEEKPAILDYTPPPGRDEMGNMVQSPQELGLWKMKTDNKGLVYYQHAKTLEISHVSPFAYPKIPVGRSEEEIACEAASIIINLIKKKISTHIQIKEKIQRRLENPVSAEEKAKYLEDKGIPYPEEEIDVDAESEENLKELSKYIYDIETVEMMAAKFSGGGEGSKDKDKDNASEEDKRKERLAFMENAAVRKFKSDLYTETGPTLLETDLTDIGIPQLRKIVEGLAQREETFEELLDKTRTNLKDFSFILMERVMAEDKEKEEARKAEEEAKSAERKEEMRRERIAAKKEARRKKREEEAEAAAKLAASMERMRLIEEGIDPDAPPPTDGEAGNADPEAAAAALGDDAKSVASAGSKAVASGTGAPTVADAKAAEKLGDDGSVVSAAKSVGDKSKASKDGQPQTEDAAAAAAAAAAAKSDDKSVRSKDSKSAVGSKAGGGDDDDYLDMLDDEERVRPEADDNKSETSDITGIDDIELEEPGDPDVLLYGEVSLDFSNPEFNEDIMRTSLNLVNFSVFCGYANLRIDEAPDDANKELSMLPEAGDESVPEDQWLTHSFFLGINKERIDAVREVTSLQYDPILGLLNSIPLSTQRLTGEGVYGPDHGKNPERPKSKAFTQASESVNENLRSTHALWKSQQLMMEVLRYQFQQSAVRAAFFNRFSDLADESTERRRDSKQSVVPPALTAAAHARQRPIELAIKRVIAQGVSDKVWAHQQPQYIQLAIGTWNVRTPSITNTGRALVWTDLNLRAVMPLDRIQLYDMLVEAFDEHELRQNALISSGRRPINKLLGPMLGSDVEIEFDMLDAKKNPTGGKVKVLMSCDYLPDQPPFNPDPEGHMLEEINIVQSPVPEVFIPMADGPGGESQKSIQSSGKHTFEASGPGLLVKQSSTKSIVSELAAGGVEDRMLPEGGGGGGGGEHASLAGQSVHTAQTGSSRREDDALSGHFPQSLNEQQMSFEQLVADLRGDGCSFIKRLVGDVVTGDVLRVGHRINEEVVKPLPNFKKATSYLQKMTQIHNKETEQLRARVATSHARLEELLAAKTLATREVYDKAKREYDRTVEVSADIKEKVKRIVASLDDLRKPAARPIEPTFPPQPDVAYVPKVPEKGALDEKGKKKKQIPNADLKEILTSIEEGRLDEKEWDFGKFWPTQAQLIKISKALQDRNDILDANRLEENSGRMKIMDRFNMELELWENNEKARKIEFDKTKKESRKANLRLDFYLSRSDRRHVMLQNLETDMESLAILTDLHKKSKDRAKVMGMKQYFEAERQKENMMNLRKRLLKALDARKRALDLPRGAVNKVQFEELRCKAEEALRSLRVEVVECKQLLVAEGIRLRNMRYDETTVLKNEQVRADMTMETLAQKDDIDKVVAKYQYEVLHLLEAMEKLVVIEADKDDRGLKDTVDNMGERYTKYKKWESNEIASCQALIDLCMEKINLTEGYATTSTRSMRMLVEALTTKWGYDFAPVRDSWCENSDYERSQRLVHDVVQWVAIQRNKLGEQEKRAEHEAIELRLQVRAAQTQQELMLKNQESDTKYVTESALSIVNVMQSHIAEMKMTARKREEELDKQVTEVVKECQQVREQLMFQAQANNAKEKLLWAMISTLQTATQSLSTRMDLLIEERDRTVYRAKLESDMMRSQLRLERKHAASLLFIIHSQRGAQKYLKEVIKFYEGEVKRVGQGAARERAVFRREIWEQIFCFTRLSTDVDALFEFFAARLANLAGSRKLVNDQLANNGAALVLSALCKSSRPLVRKYAARALGGLGWDGYVETRILLWDCVMHWKLFKAAVLEKEKHAYREGFKTFAESGKFDSLLNIEGTVEEFVPSGNMSLRTIIKQRRQWALRATRRMEGPNVANQRLINMKDGVIPSLMQLATKDGVDDWEISRSAALAISIASFEQQNHFDMTNDQVCVALLIKMCSSGDAEVQTHAAVTIANLCHKDENAQAIFGNSAAVPAIVGMCKSIVVDVLEAATSALANLTCYCDPNCHRVMACGGVAEMVRLVTQAYSENLLDLDQNDEVQANAAEMLANVSRVNGEYTCTFFDRAVVDAIVLMCAATNKQVKRHAPLVLGNIAQSEDCREIVGERGGIEALLLVLEDDDLTIKANTLWALCNLMWFPPNQERAGRFLGEIITYLTHEYHPIRVHANILLANLLYYNNPNRVRFLETEGAMELIVDYIRTRVDVAIVDACLRSVLALSYLDNIALWMGTEGDCITMLLSLMVPAFYSRDSMRYALEICSNLCVHHSNRVALIDNRGIEIIISLQQDSDPHIVQLSNQIIAYIEDVTPAEVLNKAKLDIGLDRMVVLATNQDPLVRAVAAESIGEEVWRNPKMQKRALEIGGIDALLAIINNQEETVASLLPALWSLRNLLHANSEAQAQVAHRDGLVALTLVVGRAVVGTFDDQTEKVLEAVLACMAATISNHERNARRLLVVGLEAIMDLADGKMSDAAGANSAARGGMSGEGVLALAKSILLMLGPYNYVVCRNCHKKQDLNGTNCFSCGHRLRVEPIDKEERTIMQKATAAAAAAATSGGGGGGGGKKHLPLMSATAPAALGVGGASGLPGGGGAAAAKAKTMALGAVKKVNFPAPGGQPGVPESK